MHQRTREEHDRPPPFDQPTDDLVVQGTEVGELGTGVGELGTLVAHATSVEPITFDH